MVVKEQRHSLYDCSMKKVYKAHCCGKKRSENQLEFKSNSDRTSIIVRCKKGKGCKNEKV